MRAHEIINEYAINKPLIVVDIQPAYMTGFGWLEPTDVAKHLNKTKGPVLMFVNAEDTEATEDSMEDIKYWWTEQGLKPEREDDFVWFDKGYGHLRDFIDEGISDATIIRCIREMYRQKVTHFEEMFDGDLEKLQEFMGDEWEDWMKHGTIYINSIEIGALKKFSGCYLCGGGREECLKEIMLLMNAFNIKYTLIDKFIY